MADSERIELYQRLKYTLVTSTYEEVDQILQTLIMKENVGEIYQELFEDCSVNSEGEIVCGGFFANSIPSASLEYALYNLLGWAPESFLLKHKVRKIFITRAVGMAPVYKVPQGIFLLPAVEEIGICNMGLKELPPLTQNCPSLKKLDLSRNALATLPTSFLRFSRLRNLDLSYNFLSEISPLGNRLPALKHLQLQGNHFRSFPENVLVLKHLETLDLRYNEIEKLPDNTRALDSIKTLSLAYNCMEARTEALWEHKSGKEQEQFSLNF